MACTLIKTEDDPIQPTMFSYLYEKGHSLARFVAVCVLPYGHPKTVHGEYFLFKLSIQVLDVLPRC